MKLEHGNHNKDVCEFLNLKCTIDCNDWIVTTAFYSAIHFLDHALFPCSYEERTFNNINEAHNYIRSNSKHATRGILLSKLMPLHKSEYSFLIEESQNARYSNYQVNPFIAQKAVSFLERIAASYNKKG